VGSTHVNAVSKQKKHKKISKLCVCEEWEKRENVNVNVNGKREDERIRG